MSVVRQGDLVVTIGTGGRSPALATYLQDHVTQEMGPEWADLLRAAVRGPGVDTGLRDVQRDRSIGDGPSTRACSNCYEAADRAEAKELLQACLSSSSD